MKVKKTVISILLVITGSLSVNAQERDLGYYIEQARANSPLINQANNENAIVSLDLEQMNRILYKPEINLVSGFVFSPIVSMDNNKTRFQLASENATNYIGHDLAITDGGNYTAMVSVRKPLLAASKLEVYSNKADISKQINENDIALTEHELNQVVAYQYLLCTKSAKEAENTRSLIRELEEKYRLLQKLVVNGIYKQTDLMLMQIELENYNLEHKSQQSEYASNLFDLNLVCGISDTSIVRLQDIDITIDQEVSATSGFLVGFRLDSLDILSEQAIDELKYKPQLDLFADAGLNAAYLPSPKRFGISAGLSFTWNIFDGNQRDIQRKRSAINLQTLEFNKNHFMTQNEINKNKILEQIESVDERIMLTEKQAVTYGKLYDAYSKELSIGEASVMDFKNLLQDISANKQELLLLKSEKQFLINSYNYLNY